MSHILNLPRNSHEFFSNIDIQFDIGECRLHAVNLISTHIIHDFPMHSHGIGCYEIHYISEGHGTLIADGREFDITPNTLFITGPLVPHAQITDKSDPMLEWCIYLRADDGNEKDYDSLIRQFLAQKFWIGQDNQELLPLFRKLFLSLKAVRQATPTW